MQIPLFATNPEIERLQPVVSERLEAVVRSGRYILGPEVEAFEGELAAFLGADHCVGVGNGTDALTIALRALGVEPGAEVLVPAFTFFATAEAVVNAGCVPVLCDVDAETHVLTAATAEPAIGPRTQALLPVHLFGNPAPMEELMALAERHGLCVLEDAAQAAGAVYRGRRAGALGHAATFSFYPSKNLGGMGDGGAVTTPDPAVAERVRQLRFHGSEDKITHREVGYNSRLDELQAAVLRVHLEHLQRWTDARRAAAAAYAEAGIAAAVRPQRETEGAECCFHLYVVRAADREALRAGLAERGIASRAYYTVPMHRQPALAAHAPAGPLPAAEQLCADGLALPMGPALAIEDARRVAEAVVELA